MVSGAVSAGGASSDVGAAPETDQHREARSAIWVGIHASAVRCLLTYIVAPAAGALGVVLGPIGLVLQVLGTVTAISGARRLWTLRHRGRLVYTAAAGVLTLFTAATIGQLFLGGPP